MADAVTTQIIQDGPKNAVIKFTDVSDGVGESAVLKVDVSTLSADPILGLCTSVRIEKIWFDISGMQVEILWDADTDVISWILTPGQHEMDFSVFGGLVNNAGTGKTGDIRFTTLGASAGDTYSIILGLLKNYTP